MTLRITAAIAALIAGTSAAFADEVRVYNWSDYIEESLLEKFTAETGIKIIYDVFDSNEVLETKLLAGGTGYDVVVPSASFLQRQIQAGVFQPLDKSQLSNLGNVWDAVTDRTEQYDPSGAYSVNYMWGTTGIGYNTEKVEQALGANAPTSSLALVFDPANAEKLSECGFYMLDAPTEMIPAALAYLGKNPDSQDADDIRAAGEVLAAVRPFITKFDSSEYISALANG
ncbi:MAG: extracellular solute-binding protein, partial [Pseudomonadota bacterium]